MFTEAVYQHKKDSIKPWPIHSNRASEIGHPCLRYHVYNRTRWEEKLQPEIGLKFIFEMGHHIEKIVIDELKEAGFTITNEQRPFVWREYNITGTIDGMIHDNDGNVYPFDVKSCSPWVYKKINSVDDLKTSKHFYHRNYPVQLNCYMLMAEISKGLFFFKCKSTGAIKEIWMQLDYQLGEETIRKCEAINKFVTNGDIPDRITFDERICGDCGYRHICLPEVVHTEVEIDTSELEDMIDRMEQLRVSSVEFDEINDQINEMVIGKPKILAGKYYIGGKWIERKNGAKYWKKSIITV